MRFFSRHNVVDLKATVVAEPWTLTPYAYDEYMTKPQIQALWRRPDFRHHFLTGFEGQTESVFVSAEVKNRPVKMHCLIVDYDATLSDETITYVRKYQPCDYVPSWIVTTVSGHARLIWDFESPISFSNDNQIKAFLQQLARRLALSRWLPGLDLKCLKSPYQCYELGNKWEKIADYKIPTLLLQNWLLDASKGISLLSPEESKIEIPIEIVAEEVEKRFPGRWKGEFKVGARSLRFWDPSADNETAAVVCPEGMVCFTGPSPFMTWKSIFGPAFVEQYEAAKSASVLKKTLWDERNFWLQLDDENWERFDSGSYTRWLKCQGLSGKPEAPGQASEVEQVLTQLQIHCRIRGALPFIYHPHGPMIYRGERVLNISRVRVLQPMPPGIFHDFPSAIKTFPFVWAYLSQFLDLVDGRPIQLTYLLNWIKHFYETGYYQRPSPGHAIVLAGRRSKGKSFFATVLLGKLMGGSDDGSDYLVKGSQWSNQLAKWPIAVVDDDQGSVSSEGHAQFSALVKKLVANQRLSYNGKYEATGQVDWNGRVVIACNDDPESLRLLPSLDASISDKISLLRINPDSKFVFPGDREKTQRILDEELPFFARFLLDMPYTKEWIDARDTRYHLRPFYHQDLLAYASRGASSYTVFEYIVNFLDAYRLEKPSEKVWRGTATQLLQLIVTNNVGVPMGRMNPRNVGIALGQMRAKGIDVKPCGEGDRQVQEWEIPVDVSWRDGEFFVRKSGAVADFLENSNNNVTQQQQKENADAGSNGNSDDGCASGEGSRESGGSDAAVSADDSSSSAAAAGADDDDSSDAADRDEAAEDGEVAPGTFSDGG
jgi:hypothetical protein